MRIQRILLALACAAVAFACAGPSAAFAGDGGLVVGCDDWPPYEYKEDGRFKGIAMEILQEALRRIEQPVASIEQYPWARGLRLLEGGGLDVLCSGVMDTARLGYVRYHQEPLVESRWALFVRSDDEERLAVRQLADLDGKALGIVRGYSYSMVVDEYLRTHGHVVEVSSDRANLELLLRGRVDYVLCDLFNGLDLRRRMGAVRDVEPLEDVPFLPVVRVFVLFSRKRVPAALVDRFDEELRAMRVQGVVQGIVGRYQR
ncbi:substrate-binding periplasmic protein [Desulfocurvus sp. DL9XJH121]